jgi:hypothetical protein
VSAADSHQRQELLAQRLGDAFGPEQSRADWTVEEQLRSTFQSGVMAAFHVLMNCDEIDFDRLLGQFERELTVLERELEQAEGRLRELLADPPNDAS